MFNNHMPSSLILLLSPWRPTKLVYNPIHELNIKHRLVKTPSDFCHFYFTKNVQTPHWNWAHDCWSPGSYELLTHICICRCIHIYLYIHVFMYRFIHIYIYIYMIYTYMHILVYTYFYIYTYTYTYTYTYACRYIFVYYY